ncbi:MAG: permease [Acidobacteria bacterium]|nr:permease [Acidobacteriota bacterium]
MSESRVSCCGSRPAVQAAPGVWKAWGWVLPALVLGVLAFAALEPLSRWLLGRVLGLDLGTRLGSAAAFFLSEGPRVLLLLAGVTFLVGFLQSFLDPVRTRDILARRAGAWGNLLASLFGIVTPFCSCSAVPLFIGFVRVGVPLGVTFSYLVAAPMINEVALVLLLAMFGWKIAALYAATGISVAFLSGWILGKFRLEAMLEPWVWKAVESPEKGSLPRPRGEQRLALAWRSAREIVGKVWPFVLLGIGVGAFIHGYIPEGVLARFMGKSSWWTVPLAVLIGVPLYASTAVVLPIVQTLLAKGAALGTVLAFMMAVTALSVPEVLILRRVLKARLIALFLGIVTLGILTVGYLFNLLL